MNKRIVERKQLPPAMNVLDVKPNPKRFLNVYKAAAAWSAKHPNPFAPRSRTMRLAKINTTTL